MAAVTFGVEGSYSWTVPGGVTQISAVLWAPNVQFPGIADFIAVTPGETLTILVGGLPLADGTGGFNGGGNGTVAWSSPGVLHTSAGCGATEIRRGATRLSIHGGSGGPAFMQRNDGGPPSTWDGIGESQGPVQTPFYNLTVQPGSTDPPRYMGDDPYYPGTSIIGGVSFGADETPMQYSAYSFDPVQDWWMIGGAGGGGFGGGHSGYMYPREFNGPGGGFRGGSTCRAFQFGDITGTNPGVAPARWAANPFPGGVRIVYGEEPNAVIDPPMVDVVSPDLLPVTVDLDGSNSTVDPGLAPLTYRWTVNGTPEGGYPGPSLFTFDYPIGSHLVSLTVRDTSLTEDIAYATVTIRTPSVPGDNAGWWIGEIPIG